MTNFLLLRGNIGRPGAGVCPVRGHSQRPGRPHDGHLRADAGVVPRRAGRRVRLRLSARARATTRSTRSAPCATAAPTCSSRWAATSSRPPPTPTSRTARCARCGLTVQVSTKLNRSHLVHGTEALILPCLGRTDRDVTAAGLQRVTVEDSMGMVHASRGTVRPRHPQLRSEVAIVCGIAQRHLRRRPARPVGGLRARLQPDPGPDRPRRARLPVFNAKIDNVGFFALPNGRRDTRTLRHRHGKANFNSTPLRPWTLPQGQLLLQTLRSHDQYNTTMYGLDDRYRGIHGGRRVVFVNPDDVARAGLRGRRHRRPRRHLVGR